MNALRLTHSREGTCTAGAGLRNVLTAIVNCGFRGTGGTAATVRVAAYDPETEVHRWWPEQTLQPGEVLTVELIETDVVDPPSQEYRLGGFRRAQWFNYLLPSCAVATFAVIAMYYQASAGASVAAIAATATLAGVVLVIQHRPYLVLLFRRRHRSPPNT